MTYLCHLELWLGVIFNRREFLLFWNHKEYGKWWLSHSGFYFYGIILKAHYSITLKILRFKSSALASFEFQNCIVPRTVTSSKLGALNYMDTEFYLNADVGKSLLVMMTSEKKLSANRFAVRSDLTHWQRPPKKSPYQLENCTFLHNVFKNFDQISLPFAEWYCTYLTRTGPIATIY